MKGVRSSVADIFPLLFCSNQWEDIFPSRSSDIASDLPLWAVQEDFAPGTSSVTTFMGGWTKAYAKQYNLGKF